MDRVFYALQDVKSPVVLRMKDARYMDVSGAMALLNFIEQSDKSGLNVTLEQVPVHIKKTLVTMASNEQKDKLLFAEVDVM